MAKKSFKEDINPAMNFISPESVKAKEVETITHNPDPGKTISEIRKETPEGFKVNPLYIETRSKRVQILIQPSLYEKLKNQAKEEGVSVNEVINSILLEEYKGDE